MATFITGSELNAKIEKTFEDAESQIIIISPYIKLHDRIKSVLQTKLNNDLIEITLVFGKNEENISKSINNEDLDFLKQFPNIKIYYEKRLHAKYYANESQAILTSMNLYSFSINNNIEFGVLTKATLLSNLIKEDSLDSQAWGYFNRVINQAELLFEKSPQYESANLGLSKKYINSIIKIDLLSDKIKFHKITSTPKTQIQTNNINNKIGYCIRTGKEIPFNIKKPMCIEAYKEWAKYNNSNYPEKYCHFSGEPSKGETSVKNPILKKNWKRAKEIHKF